jgi:hypothetical protein
VRIAVALAVVVLAGCGGGDGAGGEPVEHEVDLTVTVWPNGIGGDETTWVLQCLPEGGDHPDIEGACATLASLDDPFGTPKPVARCEEIPGATPEEARIKGTYLGRRVDEMFDRSSGCVFERWDRLGTVFQTGF